MNNFKHLEIPDSDCQSFGKLTLRPYQQAAFNAVIAHVKSSSEPAIVSASVGAGKTVIIAALCKHVADRNGSTLVLSRQSEIIEQDHEDCTLAGCLNSLYSASSGVKSAAYKTIMGTEKTVWNSLEQDLMHSGLIQTDKPKRPSKLFNYTPDLVLIDEAHMVDFTEPNSVYMKILAELKRRNPKVKIIGLTGTPYRGVIPIIGKADEYLWKTQLTDIPTEYLTNLGYLVSCEFGFSHDEVGYDLSGFQSKGQEGAQDFTAEEMRQMESLMVEAETTTEKIMIEVMAKTKDRNVCMITCAGKKHCQEAAKFLPKGTYAIITDDLSAKLRKKYLKQAYDGELKYLLQVGCLTTGLNIPLIDTIVILRKIGSLTLLVQLIGRGLRLLKDFQEKAGIKKEKCLVLDYSDTLTELHGLYENPILEEADLSKSKDNDKIITCPKCGTENGENAVRCRGLDHAGARCDFFWRSRICEPFFINGVLKNPGCGAENAPTARNCRCCENTLIDPNAKLTNKSYSEADYKPVERFEMGPTRNGGVFINYYLPNGEVAKKYFNPFGTNKINKTIFYNQFIKHHAKGALAQQVRKARNAGELCQLSGMLDTVAAITHRINAKGDSVIAKFILKE